MLKLSVPGPAQGISEREGDLESPWRPDLLCDFTAKRDTYRGHAVPFQCSLYQPDGLMAHRSDRTEEDHIDAGVPKQLGRSGRAFLDETSRCRYRAHEAERFRMEATYRTIFFKLHEPLDGKGEVVVRGDS